MSASTLMLGFVYQFTSHNISIQTPFALIGVALFIAAFEIGPGPLFWVPN